MMPGNLDLNLDFSSNSRLSQQTNPPNLPNSPRRHQQQSDYSSNPPKRDSSSSSSSKRASDNPWATPSSEATTPTLPTSTKAATFSGKGKMTEDEFDAWRAHVQTTTTPPKKKRGGLLSSRG